jgi:hypothetical protein
VAKTKCSEMLIDEFEKTRAEVSGSMENGILSG